MIMSETDKKLTIKFLFSVLAVLMLAWSTAYGYTWVRLGSIENNYNETRNENIEIKTQLSQIQADIQWIKYNLQK